MGDYFRTGIPRTSCSREGGFIGNYEEKRGKEGTTVYGGREIICWI